MSTIKTGTISGHPESNKLTVPSTLTVGNTIITNGSAGSTTITGEGGSTTTNLQQGLVKMWAHFDTSGDDNIDDSFNVASKTDNATGDHYMNFTNNMASVSYVGHHDGNENAIGNSNFYGSGVRSGGYATSSLRLFLGYDPGTVTGTDVDSQACAAHGDLA